MSTSLEDRIKARVQEQIPDLLSDEDLRALVTRGVDEALFKERRVPRAYGGMDIHPSLAQEVATKVLEQRMREAVDAWIKEHPEEMEAAVQRVVQDGVGRALIAALDQRFGYVFESGINQMRGMGLLPPVVP